MAMLVIAIAPVAVIYAKAMMATDLQGRWQLVQIGDTPLTTAETGQQPYFMIEGGAISGFDGCNRFAGQLDQPSSIMSGQMACAGDQVRLPLDLIDPLAHLKSGALKGDRLTLPARGTIPAAVLVRKK
ncbi:MAG: META domain-containing protein [Hyphomicrobiales bacterium]